MAGQLSPSPIVYKVFFGIGIVLGCITTLVACWLTMTSLKIHQRSRQHFNKGNSTKENSDEITNDDSSLEQDDDNDEAQGYDQLPWWQIVGLCILIPTFILCLSGIYTYFSLFLLLVMAHLIAMVYFGFFKTESEIDKQVRFQDNCQSLLVLGTISLATAVVIYTIHAHAMYSDVARYDYYGPMRVTGVDATLDTIHVNHAWFQTTRGKVQLEFGNSWACPNQAETNCVTVTWDDSTCNKIVCSSTWETCNDNNNDDGDVTDFTLQCQQDRYADALELVNAGVQYNASTSPLQDANNWPWLYAFGTCSTCEVNRNPDKLQMAVDSRAMANRYMLLGLALLLVAGMIHWKKRTIQSQDNHIELLPNKQGTAA